MKILCPTDFSEAAFNGIEYAAKIAEYLKSSLTLVNIQKISVGEGVTMFAGGERESHKQSREASEILYGYCRDINKTFKIPADFLVMTSGSIFEKTIAEVGDKYDLIVIGTKGVSQLSTYYFGTHSYQISKEANSPVLIVPLGCEFTPFKKIVYATDYHIGDELLLKQVQFLLENFNTEIELVHVSTNEITLSTDVFLDFKNKLEQALNYNPKVSFKRVVSENIIEKLEKIVGEDNSDLLVVCLQKHLLPYQMVHKNLVKELTSDSLVPVLVFHKYQFESDHIDF